LIKSSKKYFKFKLRYERGNVILEHCKLQIGCMLIILYIAFVYFKDKKKIKLQKKITVFDILLVTGILAILFDGCTAYTVNHLDTVNAVLNRALHLFFLLGLDSFIFLLFIYMISVTTGIPKNTGKRLLICFPFIANVIIVVANIPSLEYRRGEITNYSMGVSAYTCFIMAAIYIILSLIIFLGRWRYMEKRKRLSIFTYLLVLACITAYQMFNPQSLLSSICVTVIILGAYMNQENPAIAELTHYHDEMVMGFATLVENKDGSTGGHIKRTTMYVRLLAEELRKRGHYKKIITKDYMRNLCMAAPMHDIGKISVPDAVLQKPGKLTDEEFEIIKIHATSGGKIIKDTFGHLGNEQYAQMAYEVARFHHEKWNGRGYPDGLKEDEIPLCARIMAIADVFDAVSEKRCYRDAMPLDKCFDIIKEGSGRDFDPMLVEIFLDIRDKVEQAHTKINSTL